MRIFKLFICWMGFHDYRYVNVGRVTPAYICTTCGRDPYYGA